MSFPGVANTAVVGVQRASRGEMIKAYVVPNENITINPTEIVRYCRKELASHKVPRIVEIVTELPQTVTGKVMKFMISSSGNEIEVSE